MPSFWRSRAAASVTSIDRADPTAIGAPAHQEIEGDDEAQADPSQFFREMAGGQRPQHDVGVGQGRETQGVAVAQIAP